MPIRSHARMAQRTQMTKYLQRPLSFLTDSNKRVALFVVLSILFHLLFVSTNLKFFDHSETEQLPQIQKIEMIGQQETQAILEKIRNQRDHKQMVNNNLDGKEVKPENTRFEGEKNQLYDHQSISRKVDVFNKGGEGEKARSKPIEAKKQPPSLAPTLKFSDLAVQDSSVPILEKKQVANEEPVKKVGNENLRNEGVGESANNDFIEDVPLGDTTNLNTVESKYYGFYHRIRQKLEQHWGNSIRQKAQSFYASGRRISANENYITSIKITINQKGEIVDVKIIGQSGVHELDDAAVESFNKAGPFPNPPEGLLKDGRAEIEWGFVVRS